MRTPDQCRETADAIRRCAERMLQTAFSVTGNDQNRDQRDREICDRLYRSIAIKEANKLLYGLHATDEERGGSKYWSEIAP